MKVSDFHCMMSREIYCGGTNCEKCGFERTEAERRQELLHSYGLTRVGNLNCLILTPPTRGDRLAKVVKTLPEDALSKIERIIKEETK
jgi:hypothetical protein